MDRVTRRENDRHVADATLVEINGDICTGALVDRLARVEDAAEELTAAQNQITEQMAALKAQGKEKSAKFRELLGRKMVGNSILAFLHARDLA